MSVELWIDPAADAPREHPDVEQAVHAAADELQRIATARCPAIAEPLRRELVRWVVQTTTPLTEPPACIADEDGPAHFGGETTAAILPTSRAAVVAQQHPRWRDDGAWRDLGACVMVAVGPDRYGIRLRQRGTTYKRGEVPYPNEPFSVRVLTHLGALTGEIDALTDDLRTFEADVTQALESIGKRDVRTALSRAQDLLARRSTLVGRTRSISDAHEQLTRRRPNAFKIEAPDSDETLDEMDARLERLRSELVDIPQLLLAAGSWRQAQRTETLSLVAAGLIPPTLVVGALGANVLPWDDTDDWHALSGMLLLMLGSAAAGILAVRWSMFRLPPVSADPRPAWRVVAVLALVAACTLGLYWIADGTAIRGG